MTPRLPPAFLRLPIAHRALHDKTQGRPENSRAAIWEAMVKGYGIEIDLQLSADDQAMVFHDYHLERLTATTGPVRQRTATELGAIRLGGGTEGIPTFTEVLDLVRGRVPILVELKDQDGAMGQNIGPLEDAVAEAAKEYDGPIALMSFNPHSVAYLAQAAPEIPRGLTTSNFDPKSWGLPVATCDTLRQIRDATRVGASFVSHDAKDLDAPRLQELRFEGLDILCWTITSPEEEARARQVAQNVTFEGYLPAIPG
jgi:glycerophosphoryl diester phosphodiesterase